ncbi:MAG: cytoplasmic protein [Desulfosarcinaceae bacterium]|jgi:hypothetical protein
MSQFQNGQDIDFTVDVNNLYREEAITDLKVASIRRLVPVRPDGSEDPGRTPIFVGSTQLMTPEGPLPVQARLAANNLQEAFKAFPEAMQNELSQMVKRLQEMQRDQENQKRGEDSRIIVPGR